MQLGMIGLGRMGANMVRRLMRGGHECVVYDVNADAVASVAGRASADDAPNGIEYGIMAAYPEGALADDPDLKTHAGRVSDSGEGRWTITADQLLSAMRYQLGHLEQARIGGSCRKRDAS
jgi:6-phosphogluconate dehydrogenase (decarboxylating)